MNKKIIMALSAMAIAAVLGLVLNQSLSVSADPDLSVEDVTKKVEAQYPGEIVELELDNEGKNPVYEVEIVIEGKEYELLIDGNTGDVLKLDEKLVTKTETPVKKEAPIVKAEEPAADKTDDNADDGVVEEIAKEEEQAERKIVIAPKQDTTKEEAKVAKTETKAQAAPKEPKQEQAKQTAPKENNQAKATETKQSAPKQTEQPKQEKKQEPKQEKKQEPAKKSVISRDQAIQIALGQFSGKVEDVELDDDDGRLIYEIEIESSRGEAEIEIDAYSGKVLVVDIDLDDDDDDDDDDD